MTAMPPTLKHTGADKNLTLDELEAFVRAARTIGASGQHNLFAVLSTTGKIKEIEVEITPAEEEE